MPPRSSWSVSTALRHIKRSLPSPLPAMRSRISHMCSIPNPKVRLPPEELGRMRSNLGRNGIFLQDGDAAVQKLNTLRRMYEPYVHALSEYLLMPLPSWEVALRSADNWQTSAWERIAHL